MRFFIASIIILILIAAGAVYYLYPTLYGIKPDTSNTPRMSDLPASSVNSTASSQPAVDIPAETIVAEGLDTPWAIAFLPDGYMLVTERKGTVKLVNPRGGVEGEPVATISQSKEIGEGGLLGIALHPKFNENNLVYLYYTYENQGDNTKNRVVRMSYKGNHLVDEQILVDNIPGASNHNGGRIKFGPDNYLYITTGDASEPSLAQDKNSLAGKILRVTDEGKPAPGNPFNNETYSYGHRNPQGITWSRRGGVLYETEHGPSGGQYGVAHDEFNFIQQGKNYGWPVITGGQSQVGMEYPIKESGDDTWAPGGAAYYQYPNDEGSVFFGGLKGQALYEFQIDSKENGQNFKTHLKGKYGRIREVILGPDNMLYITTSNRDGRGVPQQTDDRIIRINPEKL